MRLFRLGVSLGMVIVASLACASESAPALVVAGSDTNTQLVGVTLGEFSIKTDTAEVGAGKVTFAVRNDGSMKHELVVLQSGDATLPVDPRPAR